MENELEIEAQLKWLYFNQRWPIKRISKFIDVPESVLRMYLKEMPESETETKTENLPATISSKEEAYKESLFALKSSEVDRQIETTPIVNSIEISALFKIMRMIKSCSDEDITGMKTIVETFKTLTKDSALSVVTKLEPKDQPNNSVNNVQVQVLSFRD